MRGLTIGAFVCLSVAAVGCDDRSYRDIGAAIDVLAKRSEELPGPAIERLQKIGRRAVPQIETAMHTASPRGKVNLVSALAAIGEPESTAILQHFATYDKSPDVRAACENLLKQWAAASDRRAQPAKLALARIEEKRRLGQAE
jgi:HEAT repeat protein